MSLLGSPAPATSVADVAMADAEMRHFIRVIDGQDLYERIKQMRGRDGYLGPSSFPPQIHAIPGASSPLPAVVLERSEAASRCGGTCFCGLLTDIGHAWASVESSLFLWKYDSHSAVPVEYAAELRSIT